MTPFEESAASAAGAATLIVTADDALLEELLRLAAAAGVTPEVLSDPVGARRSWSGAAAVLVGADAVTACVEAGLPRRRDVAVIGMDFDDPGIYRGAVTLGADRVAMLPDDGAVVVDLLADTVDGPPRASFTVGCVGGAGGAGATTLAAGLAVAAARRGIRTMLIDADPLGGGIDLVFGIEGEDGVRWPDLGEAAGRVNAEALHSALPRVGELTVLSWDRGDTVSIPSEAMRAALAAARRSCDLVVVDLPRRTDPACEEALSRLDCVLMVVPCDIRGVAAASRVAGRVGLLSHDLRLVVRTPGHGDVDTAFARDYLQLPVAAELRSDRSVMQLLGRTRIGPPARSGLGRCCDTLLDGFGVRPAAAA